MDAFDADVLIYAAAPGHPLGRRVLSLLENDDAASAPARVGSLLLLPEVLSKPWRDGKQAEVAALAHVLARLDLRPVDAAIAQLAVELGAVHRLRAPDAVHLATAVQLGADRFVTNNRRDFAAPITEVSVTYPADLPDPG